MARIFLIFSFLTIFCLSGANAQSKDKLTGFADQLSFNKKTEDILKEDDDMKKLILKYDAATAAEKPAVKKEIEKLQLKKEEESIQKEEQRIKRQEAKIKQIKENAALRRKNKAKSASERVEYLIKPESIQKVKEESTSKKVKDKIKEKR